MLLLDETQTRDLLPWEGLIDALALMFQQGCVAPLRAHHSMELPNESDAVLLIMPAWSPGKYSGVKILSVFPDNHRRALPAIHGTYFLSSGETGKPLAIIDGGELTARRTAAASALAARHLARVDARHLLVCATGRLAANLVQAHAAVRPIERVTIWGRNRLKAKEVASDIEKLGYEAGFTEDLEAAASEADIISCATLAKTPFLRGEWLKPGVHVDLIGAFAPDMRESDDEAVRRSRIFVDTREGALHEAGDLIQPLQSGVIQAEAIQGELRELQAGSVRGRTASDEITLFKSVGAALEDLAGAIFAYENAVRRA
ncbi:ornithine cyclodeaminase family protein [Oryzifoliimicrobium ureilyticus]|uniref:ornithine cyclodeaminase family protein n=1 Tax=Oryzifoliimicrobium ureilyticus TaxID=3113724 RepID=UPI00307656F0